MTNLHDQYTALTQAGFVSLPNRTLIRMNGVDRQTFLHSFCTADVKAMEPGQATEAFVLNDKGKILGHVILLALNDTLLLSGAGKQAATIIEHLDKYIIRDDVQLEDASETHSQTFICGSDSTTGLDDFLTNPFALNQVQLLSIDGTEVIAAQVEVAGFGTLLVIETSNQDALTQKLVDSNIAECSEEALLIVRIENQTPWFGNDIDDRNLPQELQRDEKAISFNKGCYLGQETVARIDAIGHVNQWLVGLKFSEPNNAAIDGELSVGEKQVGRVTSVSPTPDGNGTIGLGFVRRMHAKEGAVLTMTDGTATVIKKI